MPTHQVIVPIYPGIQPLDVVGPHEVLRSTAGLPERGYDVTLVAHEPGSVRAESGPALVATAGLPESGPIGTLLVPGGHGILAALEDGEFIDWLRRACARAERVASVCSGAFLLAAAGVLDGHPATTHWRWAFSREFTRLLGCPPGDYVEQVRVDTARRLLESEPLLLTVAAARAGFGYAETMRRAFLRRLGVSPDHYRRHFATP